MGAAVGARSAAIGGRAAAAGSPERGGAALARFHAPPPAPLTHTGRRSQSKKKILNQSTIPCFLDYPVEVASSECRLRSDVQLFGK